MYILPPLARLLHQARDTEDKVEVITVCGLSPISLQRRHVRKCFADGDNLQILECDLCIGKVQRDFVVVLAEVGSVGRAHEVKDGHVIQLPEALPAVRILQAVEVAEFRKGFVMLENLLLDMFELGIMTLAQSLACVWRQDIVARFSTLEGPPGRSR